MPTLALALATAVVCAPIHAKLTPTVLREAAWRIPPRCILIAPAKQTEQKGEVAAPLIRNEK